MCSQCRSDTPPVKKIVLDQRTGLMTVDGKKVERRFMMPATQPRNVKRGRRPTARGPESGSADLIDPVDLDD